MKTPRDRQSNGPERRVSVLECGGAPPLFHRRTKSARALEQSKTSRLEGRCGKCLHTFAALFLLALALTGCGHKEGDHAHHDGDHSHGGAHGHSHGDDAESFSGATFKEGTGITVLDETRKSLGLQTAEVAEQTLPRKIRFVAHMFGAKGETALGTVPVQEATLLRTGLPVLLMSSARATTGEVQRVTKPLANDEAEVIVALRSATTLKNGDFGEAVVSVPGEKSALVIPREAVIRGAMGDLVYVVNGEAYLLTWVELGAESGGLVEVTDGLLAGDSVVTRGAMDLWLVELRAQKGGQGCCPAPPKKERK
jgi:hypothetical protein